MPKAAFQEVWDTIQAGKEWTGIVKNLRKDGRYYWVYSHIAPVLNNGEITGYTAARRPASDNEILEIIPVYKDLMRKRKHTKLIKKGVIHKMYYIVNQTNHIIAADNSFYWSHSLLRTMNELHKSIALKYYNVLTTTDNELSIHTSGEKQSLILFQAHILSSLLGEMKLIVGCTERRNSNTGNR